MNPAQAATLNADLDAGGEVAGGPMSTPSSETPIEVAPESFEHLLNWAVRERVAGLLCAAIESGIIDVEAQVGALERAREIHREALRSSIAAEATAVQAVSVLRRAGIEALAFKGVANAHLDYTDPAMRTFFDADLHVTREDFGRAIDTLTTEGFQKSPTFMSARWERRFARACELRSPDGVELDLHAAVATGYFGAMLDHDQLRSAPDRFALGGEPMSAFCLPARALISCYGIVLSRGPGVRLQRDLIQQIMCLGDRWPEVLELSGEEGRAVIAKALGATMTTFGAGPDWDSCTRFGLDG